MATDADLLDIVDGGRVDQFRFDVVNASLSKIGTLDVIDAAANVTNNIHATIKRTATFAPKPGALDEVNILTDRIRPVMVLSNGSEYNLGVFLFADTSSVRWSYGTLPSPTLVDQGLIVDQPTDQAIGAAAGSSVKTLIEGLLSAAGIGLFDVGVDATVTTPMAWPPGVSRQTVINQLAARAGGYSLYFDNDGVARVVPAPSLDSPTLFYTKAQPRIAAGSIVESDDALDAPNRFIVIGQTGDGTGGTAVGVYDIDDAAPHSAVNRGFVVARVRTVMGLSTAAAAQSSALAWAKHSASVYSATSFVSPCDPRHDTFDVVSFDYGSGPTVWREQGWSMTLKSGGPMMHTLRRSYQ